MTTAAKLTIKVTHTDGRIEFLTEENYLGFGEWVHDLIVESRRNDSGQPILTGFQTKATYELRRYPDSPFYSDEPSTEPNPPTTDILDTLTVSLPRMEGNKIAYSLLHNDTIVGSISQSKGGHHQVTVGISSFSGTFKTCVEWAKTNFLTSRQLPNTLETSPTAEETQMSHYVPQAPQEPTEYSLSEVSPIEMAVNEPECLDIIQEYVENLMADRTYNKTLAALMDELALAVLAYIAADGRDGNKAHDELARLGGRAKVRGIFKLTGQVKNDPRFRTLVEKYEPILTVSGGNERGTMVAIGTTAAEVANAPKPPKASKGTKGTKGSKDKAPKKTKETKAIPALPVITDLAALESLDRKALQSAMSITNLHKETGVKGNGKTVDILKALAKHLLGVDNYEPIVLSKEEKKFSIRLTRFKADGTPFTLTLDKSLWMMEILPGAIGFEGHVKALVAKSGTIELKDTTGKPEVKLELVVASQSKGSSKGKDESPLPMPEGLCWDKVKGMKYRQLQALCKVFRSNGLYQGNLIGKGVLLKAAAAAMRALGHDIVEVSVPAQDPDNAKPLLERPEFRAEQTSKANDLLALAK